MNTTRLAAVSALCLGFLKLGAWAQSNERVSTSAAGGSSPSGAYSISSISNDGRYIAFVSVAPDLVVSDSNGQQDVFVRDVVNNATELVSISSAGVQANASCDIATSCMSQDGRFVVFSSNSTTLSVGDVNGMTDVFIRDRVAGTTQLLSILQGGVQPNAESNGASISADGRFVAFVSSATNIHPLNSTGWNDVYVKDRETGAIELISVDVSGTHSSGGDSASISADGRFVAFVSSATDLVVGDANGFQDAFVRDRVTQHTVLVSVNSTGAQANHITYRPIMSAHGERVVFATSATNLDGPLSPVFGIYVRDLLRGTTALGCIGLSGAAPNGVSGWEGGWTLSANGRYLVFDSYATNLVSGLINTNEDVFVRDLDIGTTQFATFGIGGALGNGYSRLPAVSANGRYVSFTSSSNNLVQADTNNTWDVFIADRGTSPASTVFCSGSLIDADHVTPCPCGNWGGVGNGCANSAHPFGAHLSHVGTPFTDDVSLVGSGMPATSSCIYLQGDSQTDVTFGDGVLCTAGTLVRLRTRTNAAGASSFPDNTDTVTLSIRGGVAPGSGQTRYYQTYYRNSAAAFCPPATFNVTNGVMVVW